MGYDIEQRILAFNIGAATPLIITSLARGFRLQAEGPPRAWDRHEKGRRVE